MRIFDFKEKELSFNYKFLLTFLVSIIWALLSGLLLVRSSVGINIFLITTSFVALAFIIRSLFKGEIFVSRYDIIPLIMIVISLSMIFYKEPGLASGSILYLLLLAPAAIVFPNFPDIYKRFSYIQAFFISHIEAFTFLGRYFDILKKLKLQRFQGKHTKLMANILAGFLISIPFVFVIGGFLSMADNIFGEVVFGNTFEFIGKFFKNTDLVFEILFISVFAFIFAISIYSLAFLGSKKPYAVNQHVEVGKGGLNTVVSTILINNINLLFFLFIIVQFVYLFGGEKNISEFGFTYSEYARKGFFELQFVTSIIFLIIYTLYRFTKSGRNTGKWLVKLSLSLNILFTLIIIFSAHFRMQMYVDAYGYTILRYYPHMVILLEGVLFIYLFASLFYEKMFTHLSLFALIISSMFLIGISFRNPVDVIIHSNFAKKEIDFRHIESFGIENEIYSKADEDPYLFCDRIEEVTALHEKKLDLRSFNLIELSAKNKTYEIINRCAKENL